MKKVLFVACLLTPLALFIYGKVTQSPLYKTTEVIRQIPLNSGTLKDDFKQFPKVTLPPTIPHAAPVIPKKTPVKPHTVKPMVCKAPAVLPPPVIIAPEVFEEKEPVEYCAFGWLSVHCGFAAR